MDTVILPNGEVAKGGEGKEVCNKCLSGACCIVEGSIGLTAIDILRMATYLNITIEEFMLRFTIEDTPDENEGENPHRLDPGNSEVTWLRRKTEHSMSPCVMLKYEIKDGIQRRLCSIYPARPLRCRDYDYTNCRDTTTGQTAAILAKFFVTDSERPINCEEVDMHRFDTFQSWMYKMVSTEIRRGRAAKEFNYLPVSPMPEGYVDTLDNKIGALVSKKVFSYEDTPNDTVGEAAKNVAPFTKMPEPERQRLLHISKPVGHLSYNDLQDYWYCGNGTWYPLFMNPDSVTGSFTNDFLIMVLKYSLEHPELIPPEVDPVGRIIEFYRGSVWEKVDAHLKLVLKSYPEWLSKNGYDESLDRIAKPKNVIKESEFTRIFRQFSEKDDPSLADKEEEAVLEFLEILKRSRDCENLEKLPTFLNRAVNLLLKTNFSSYWNFIRLVRMTTGLLHLLNYHHNSFPKNLGLLTLKIVSGKDHLKQMSIPDFRYIVEFINQHKIYSRRDANYQDVAHKHDVFNGHDFDSLESEVLSTIGLGFQSLKIPYTTLSPTLDETIDLVVSVTMLKVLYEEDRL